MTADRVRAPVARARSPPGSLELSAVIPAGRLIGDGVQWQIAHAVAAAMPGAAHPDGRIVLSVNTARYQGTGISPIDPGLAG